MNRAPGRHLVLFDSKLWLLYGTPALSKTVGILRQPRIYILSAAIGLTARLVEIARTSSRETANNRDR
jgi:hypothetical protein